MIDSIHGVVPSLHMCKLSEEDHLQVKYEYVTSTSFDTCTEDNLRFLTRAITGSGNGGND